MTETLYPTAYIQKSALSLPSNNAVMAGQYGARLFNFPELYNPIAPQPGIVTILPNFDDILALLASQGGPIASGNIELFFRLKQVEYGDVGAPDGEGSATDTFDDGWWYLPYTGMRLVVPTYGFTVEVSAVGDGDGTDWEDLSVRFKTEFTPLRTTAKHGNTLPVLVNASARLLPRYAQTLKLDSPAAGAVNFTFSGFRGSIATYASGNEVAVPHDAFQVTAVSALHGKFTLY